MLYDKAETDLMELLSGIRICPERQSSGQRLRSIKFRLLIVENHNDLCLDSECHTECVSCRTRGI